MNIPSIIILFSVCLGYASIPLAISGVNVVAPAIATHFQLDIIATNWVLVIFVLSNGIAILPAGKLADNFGRKKIYILGILILGASSLICFYANNLPLFFSARFAQGVGGAMVFSSGLALVVSVVSRKDRGVYIGIVTSCVYVSLSLGPLVGGWLEQNYGWRSLFFLLIPISLFIVCLLAFTGKVDWKSNNPVPLDIVGTLFLAGLLAGILFSTTYTGHISSLLAIFLAAVCAVVFFKIQMARKNPLVNIRLFWKNKSLSKSFSSSVMMYSANYPVIFLIALHLQYVFSQSALQAGKILFWQTIAMAFATAFSGRLGQWFHLKRVALVGVAVFSIGLATLAFSIGETSSTRFIAVNLIVIGVGFGLFSTPNNTMGLYEVNDDGIGVGSSLLSFARVFGNISGTNIILLLTSFILGPVMITNENLPTFVLMVKWVLACGAFLGVVALVITSSQKDFHKKDFHKKDFDKKGFDKNVQ